MKLELKGVSSSLGDFHLKDFSMVAHGGSFTTIAGPSGSGKTTVLRIIAGLQGADSGKVLFGNADVTPIPAELRNVGLVFQADALFSHLDVAGNVGFGPCMKKFPHIPQRVAKALSLVRLQGFEKRNVTSLSGGEKKRVAIGRAIAFNPAILLLDEPLSGLDANLKEKMKLLLNELQKKTGLTIVMVTHDLDDAFFLSDRIVVINKGRIEQQGKPAEIFTKPKGAFVREFVSDYVLAQGNSKKGQQAKFSFPLKGRGKFLIALKKTNYRQI